MPSVLFSHRWMVQKRPAENNWDSWFRWFYLVCLRYCALIQYHYRTEHRQFSLVQNSTDMKIFLYVCVTFVQNLFCLTSFSVHSPHPNLGLFFSLHCLLAPSRLLSLPVHSTSSEIKVTPVSQHSAPHFVLRPFWKYLNFWKDTHEL